MVSNSYLVNICSPPFSSFNISISSDSSLLESVRSINIVIIITIIIPVLTSNYNIKYNNLYALYCSLNFFHPFHLLLSTPIPFAPYSIQAGESAVSSLNKICGEIKYFGCVKIPKIIGNRQHTRTHHSKIW